MALNIQGFVIQKQKYVKEWIVVWVVACDRWCILKLFVFSRVRDGEVGFLFLKISKNINNLKV